MKPPSQKQELERYNLSTKLLQQLTSQAENAIDLSGESLERVFSLLDLLGNPHLRLPPVIHLAGTNGKGSTLAALRAMVEADGKVVHVFTSPYLIRFHEQIRLAGRLISEETLVAVLEKVLLASRDMPITFFEATTVAALLAFAETPADLCLLETGLGGRLDATNVVPEPVLQIITPISYDHQEFLGEELEQITSEKAGILRRGGCAVSAPQLSVVRRELSQQAENIKSTLLLAERDWRYRPKGESDFLFEDNKGALLLPNPPLPGTHQIANAATAVAAIRTLNNTVFREKPISSAAIRAGLGWIRWPGRLQNLSESPLANDFPDQSELWLDGGHNTAAGQMLAGFAKKKCAPDRPFIMIFAMKKTKDVASFLQHFVGLVQSVIAIPLKDEDLEIGVPPAEIAGLASSLGFQGLLAKDISAALERALVLTKDQREPPFILITGSLRIAGAALQLADIEPD